jgi:Ca2+-binding EF-hand superfamily protein
MFDLDSSGKISAQELKTVLGQIQITTKSLSSTQVTTGNDLQSSMTSNSVLDDSIWKKMITEADIDGDGEISLEEFEKLMTTLLYNHNQS